MRTLHHPKPILAATKAARRNHLKPDAAIKGRVQRLNWSLHNVVLALSFKGRI